MSNTYYLFRHAETKFSKTNTPYPKDERSVPILSEGTLAIKRMANFLKPVPSDIHLSSEFLRCRQTSEIVKKITGKRFFKNKLLNEYFEETFPQFQRRMRKLIEFLQKENENKNIVLCTHGAVVAAARSLLLKKSFEIDDLYNYPPCGVLLVIKGGQEEEIDFNTERSFS